MSNLPTSQSSLEEEKDSANAQRAVALLDILGFRARMEEEDPQTLFDETLGQLPAIIGTSSELISGPEIRAVQFSDTIFLWATVGAKREAGARADPFDCVEAVCIATFGLMHRCARRGIFLRGAIAFGECFVSDSPPAFVGRAIASAAKLERRQQWSGVALDDSAEAILQYDSQWSGGLRSFVRYLVPMKKPPDEVRIVIKWPWGMHLPHPLDLMRSRVRILSEDIEAKIIHTTAFFETFQNLFGYPNRRVQPITMIDGEIPPLADAAKTHDPIDWHANALARIRQT